MPNDDRSTNLISDALIAWTVILMAASAAVLGSAAWLLAALRGETRPRISLEAVLSLISCPARPSAAFGTNVGSPWLYWSTAALLLLITATLALAARRVIARDSSLSRVTQTQGLATKHEVNRNAGLRAVKRRGRVIRPARTKPDAKDVGYRLGRSHGREVWASVEDSMVILGPPRSGKGLHLVIPMILDAPGAVLTTSTRPDNLAATLKARVAHDRPVGVFDPQHLVPGVPSSLRWSPIRGCEVPQTAITRATALAAGTANGVEGGDFWQAQTEAVLRGMLHAAALDGRDPAELYRWSLDPSTATEAVRILHTNSNAADGWADALGAAVTVDPRTRDSIWVGVRTALACLADPRVLTAVSPAPGDELDPASFIEHNGTLYLLGTSSGGGNTANLIAALVEDIVDTARRQAAQSPSGRLDPPLALILDEVANYPLPSLPTLMSDGGGTGITTVAVLQSLAQARAKWGEHEGAAIWDSAIVKIILGGGSNARDLQDLAALIGERDDETTTQSRDRHGHRTWSTSVRRVPIMDTGALRMLPFGSALMLLRSARPIPLDLQPWTARPDARALTDGRDQLEQHIRNARVPTPPTTTTGP